MIERIFSRLPGSVLSSVPRLDDEDWYEYTVRALIQDAADYEESYLSFDRQTASRYYYGQEPGLDSTTDTDTPIMGDPPVDEGTADGRSTIVSTDVRDTIMSIMPSLMRIFGASEHAVEFNARSARDSDMAGQATDYIRYKLWDDNEGFLILHAAFKDCLMGKIGIVTWYSENYAEVSEQLFNNIHYEQLQGLMEEAGEGAQITDWEPPGPDGMIAAVTIRYKKSTPQLCINNVPPEMFRIDRAATSIRKSRLVGHEEFIPAGDLIKMGYDPDTVMQYSGASQRYYSDERFERNPGADDVDVVGDLVQYGVYYIRIDQDGDGINELRKVCTFGDAFDIVEDNMVDAIPYALFTPDPKPHSAIGDSITDIVKDIQKIKTNVWRGMLDSLAQSIFPRTAINEMLVNVEDALNDDLGALIRTKGDPATSVMPFVTPFVGADALPVIQALDLLRQSRTGISEASKGVDPRALQSTTMMGVDAIVTGAQERIELIARILGETGMKDLYRGLLREVINSPNRAEEIKVRGKYIEVDPSVFDPNLRVSVNPALGKGSDQSRLMVLQDVAAKQAAVVSQYGLNNGIVGIQELRNTIEDILEVENIKNVARYFKEITPELQQAIAAAPTEPTSDMVLAKAELEKVRLSGATNIGKAKQAAQKAEQDHAEFEEEIQFKRDSKLIDAFIALATIAKEDADTAAANVDKDVRPMET